MNCPECGNKMEWEYCPFVTMIEASLPTPIIHKEPSTHYRCNECDTEWTRVSGEKKLRMLDGEKQSIRPHLRLKRDDA